MSGSIICRDGSRDTPLSLQMFGNYFFQGALYFHSIDSVSSISSISPLLPRRDFTLLPHVLLARFIPAIELLTLLHSSTFQEYPRNFPFDRPWRTKTGQRSVPRGLDGRYGYVLSVAHGKRENVSPRCRYPPWEGSEYSRADGFHRSSINRVCILQGQSVGRLRAFVFVENGKWLLLVFSALYYRVSSIPEQGK